MRVRIVLTLIAIYALLGATACPVDNRPRRK